MSDAQKAKDQEPTTTDSAESVTTTKQTKRSLPEKDSSNNGNDNEQVVESKRPKSVSPFDDLKISDDSILDTVQGRTNCSQCNKSVKYFCYRCFNVVGMDRSEIPSLKLPVPLNVIKHELELDGKSTAIHAGVIAKNDVNIYNWQNIPEFQQPERSLLLFPGPDAKRLDEIPRDSFDRITVIDGTWKQASKIARETPQLQRMQKVTIAPRKTHFWRYQQKSDDHLATIEAIYYLYREFAEAFEGSYEDGRYDNLLFYYRFFYDMIQDKYRCQQGSKKFTQRHRSDYIQYDGKS
ncbi:DTW domain-containing protein [Zychaea mexicana]|uniref:DTW domain-containing protein n=1 Tax=Zychaea mexicana TaxID=64656 RepID=UPI0022FEBA61|nr:DTW domain-containing protein [Zychaea mexicana]KAI9495593.1 DTW domain-containing protein [Zychaea mexicana]